MTDSGTGSTTRRVGDGQPHSAATPDGEPRAEADVGARPVTEPATEAAKPSPWYGRLARGLPRPTGWIATIVVGSLLVPALTKQWSDRPRELEIKTTLVREISELTTDTVTAYMMEAHSATPANSLLQRRKAALDNASKADKADARKKYMAALDAKVEESARMSEQKYSAWRTNGAAIKAQLLAYFTETQLASDWDDLDRAMLSFIRLGTTACDRSLDVEVVRSYVANNQTSANIQWQLLEESYYSDSGCYVGDSLYSRTIDVYRYAGDQIILKQQKILDTIMKADMVGFSKGWNDLVNDVIPGGS